MVDLAPIVLFVYNRPRETRLTLEALTQNVLADQSVLYVYADGAKENATEEDRKKIEEVRNIVRGSKWCKELHLIESDRNKGLANSVIHGVTEIVNRHGKVIVLEDDLVTAKGFLTYMNTSLTKYQNEKSVVQISGFNYPLDYAHKKTSFFIPITTSWGWATWDRAWKIFDKNASGYEALKHDEELARRFNLDGAYPLSAMLFRQMDSKEIDSWVIRWWWSVFKMNGVSLFPDKSLVKNIGFGDSGTHTIGNDPFPISDFDNDYFITTFPDKVIVDQDSFTKIKMTLKNVNGEPSSIKSKKIVYVYRLVISKLKNFLSK
jgi:GT2 family glycosyltransferase